MFKTREEVLKTLADAEDQSMEDVLAAVECSEIVMLKYQFLIETADVAGNHEAVEPLRAAMKLLELFQSGLLDVLAKKAADEPVLGLVPSLN